MDVFIIIIWKLIFSLWKLVRFKNFFFDDISIIDRILEYLLDIVLGFYVSFTLFETIYFNIFFNGMSLDIQGPKSISLFSEAYGYSETWVLTT